MRAGISWNRPDNKLDQPAYLRLICSVQPGTVLHGHLLGDQNEAKNKATIRRFHSALFQKVALGTQMNSEAGSEMTLPYCRAIGQTPMEFLAPGSEFLVEEGQWQA